MTELRQGFEQVEQLIRAGETGRALTLLGDLLKPYPDYTETLRLLSVLDGNFNRTRQQELKSVLSFQEAQLAYNKINDSLLALLGELKSGRKPAPAETPQSGNKNLIRIAAVLVLLTLAAVSGYWLSRPKSQEDDAQKTDKQSLVCPKFKGLGRKILLLPFQRVSGADARPELLIRARIQSISSKNNFPLDVEIAPDFNVNDQNPDANDALEFGRQCNTEMVVYGFYAGSGNSDAVQLDARFVLPKLNLEGGTGFQKLPEIVSIGTSPAFRSIDDAVFSLCGMMALNAGNPELARKWLEKVEKKDARDAGALKALEQ